MGRHPLAPHPGRAGVGCAAPSSCSLLTHSVWHLGSPSASPALWGTRGKLGSEGRGAVGWTGLAGLALFGLLAPRLC